MEQRGKKQALTERKIDNASYFPYVCIQVNLMLARHIYCIHTHNCKTLSSFSPNSTQCDKRYSYIENRN